MRRKSKEVRDQLTDECEEKITHIRSTTLVHNGVLKDKAVGKLIREIDAQKS